MRIALFADTCAPQVNGVAKTLSRLVGHARERCHRVALVSPRLEGGSDPPPHLHLRLPAVPVPFYRELRFALPVAPILEPLDAFGPEIVHVATEFAVGWMGERWAR